MSGPGHIQARLLDFLHARGAMTPADLLDAAIEHMAHAPPDWRDRARARYATSLGGLLRQGYVVERGGLIHRAARDVARRTGTNRVPRVPPPPDAHPLGTPLGVTRFALWPPASVLERHGPQLLFWLMSQPWFRKGHRAAYVATAYVIRDYLADLLEE